MKRRNMLKMAVLGTAAGVALGSGGWMVTASAKDGKISADNWGEMVGFKPDLSALKVPVGTTIDKSNVSKVKDLVPAGLEKLVKQYGLKMKVTEYKPYHPSLNYIKTTNQNIGKTKAWDVGKDYRKSGWKGYEGGLPFPQPKTGLEVAYNFLNTYTGDDADRYYDVTWINGKRGIETTEHWHWTSLRTAHRTDISPIPSVKKFEGDRIKAAAFTFALEPYDKRGFGALYFSSLDPVDLTGHVYVPAMRRVLRHSFGTRGDSWNATDFLYEDVGGYLGAPEWMNWKIVEKKTMLLPLHSGADYGKGAQTVFDVKTKPYWNPDVEWQPRPVYVLEGTPKLPDYPYSRFRLMVDAEAYYALYKEAYDKKGELWKIILTGAKESEDADKLPMQPGFAMAVDLQATHASIVTYRKFRANSNLNPNEFTVSNLKKKSH